MEFVKKKKKISHSLLNKPFENKNIGDLSTGREIVNQSPLDISLTERIIISFNSNACSCDNEFVSKIKNIMQEKNMSI